MSKLEGGIFSRPRGKTGGIVFGAARTQQGKTVTSRLLVVPANPRTAGQVLQRDKITNAVNVVRFIGSGAYQKYFNRGIGQLPGFQSLMSALIKAQDSSFDLQNIPAMNTGSLHFPDTLTWDNSVAGEPVLDFSGENVGGSLDTDQYSTIQIVSPINVTLDNSVIEVALLNGVRSDLEVEPLLSGLAVGSIVTNIVWFNGAAGTATEGLQSKIVFSRFVTTN